MLFCARRPPPRSAAASAGHRPRGPEHRRARKIVDQAEAYRVGVAVVVGHEMKILCRCIQIGQRDVLQQGLRGGANHRGIDDVGLAVVAELLAGCGIENLDGRAVFVGRAGEIAGALGGRGNGGVFVKRRAAARAVPPGEEKPLVATVENFGDVQGTADEGAELRGIVAGLRRFEAGERDRTWRRGPRCRWKNRPCRAVG